MANLHIHRAHTLGLARARQIAERWAAEAERKFDLRFTRDGSGMLSFSRSGVSGRLVVAEDHFELTAQLGFLLSAFHHTIEREIGKNLDACLAAEGQGGQGVA